MILETLHKLEQLKKCAQSTCQTALKGIEIIESSIDLGLIRTHAEISHQIQQLTIPNKQVVVQSGGTFTLTQCASNEDYLLYDLITMSITTNINEHQAKCVRTLLINQSAILRDVYCLILSLCQFVHNQLKPGQSLSTIYDLAKSNYSEQFANHEIIFPITLGRSNEHIINSDTTNIIKPYDVYYVCIEVHSYGKSIIIGDTILIRKYKNRLLTSFVPSNYGSVSYTLNIED